MADFVPGKTVPSREPQVRVDTLLDPGSYRFQLVVVDDERNVSAPAELVVSVVRGGSATTSLTLPPSAPPIGEISPTRPR